MFVFNGLRCGKKWNFQKLQIFAFLVLQNGLPRFELRSNLAMTRLFFRQPERRFAVRWVGMPTLQKRKTAQNGRLNFFNNLSKGKKIK